LRAGKKSFVATSCGESDSTSSAADGLILARKFLFARTSRREKNLEKST
jgi:hypothetical protein